MEKNLQPLPLIGHKWFKLIVISTSLVLACFASLALTKNLRPFWLNGNSDPSHIYLISSLDFALHKQIVYTDHPGTPIQIITGFLLRAVHYFTGNQPLEQDVFLRSEKYLEVTCTFFFLTYFLGLLIVGLYALRLKNRLFPPVVFLMSPILFASCAETFRALSSEWGILIVNTLLMAGILSFTFHDINRTSNNALCLIGFICGIGVSCKLTFLTMLGIPLLLSEGWKQKLRVLASSGIGFFVCTLPVLSQYKRIFLWGNKLFLGSGHYGMGRRTIFPAPKEMWESLLSLLSQEPIYFSILFMAILLTGIAWRKSNVFPLRSTDQRQRVLAAIVISHLVLLMMVLKHPDSRYLLVSIGNVPLIICLVWDLAPEFSVSRKWQRISASLVLIGCFFIFDLRINRGREIQKDAISITSRLLKDYSECGVINTYLSSSEGTSLVFGNFFANRSYSEEISNAFPNHLSFFPQHGWILEGGKTVTPSYLSEKYRCLVVRGSRASKGTEQCVGNLHVETILELKYEALYLVDAYKPICG